MSSLNALHNVAISRNTCQAQSKVYLEYSDAGYLSFGFNKGLNKTFTLNFFMTGNKIQISKTTWLMLSMKGGYLLEERGFIQIKVNVKNF